MGLWTGAAPAGYAKGLVAQKDIVTHGARMGLSWQRFEIDIVKLSPLTGLRGDRSNQRFQEEIEATRDFMPCGEVLCRRRQGRRRT